MKQIRRVPNLLKYLTIPFLLAVAFGLFERHFSQTISPQEGVPQLIMGLAANSRFHAFVILPSWLIAATATIFRARTSQRLLRFGSWRAIVIRPLWNCMRAYFIAASAIATTWLVIFADRYGASGRGWIVELALSILILLGATIVIGASLMCLYMVLLLLQLASQSSTVVRGAALCIWVWSTLSNIGIISSASLLDLVQYMSIYTVGSRPQTMFVLAAASVAWPTLAWLLANHRDEELRSGGKNSRISAQSASAAVAFGLVALGAISSAVAGRPLQLTGSDIFYGVGGSVAQYLIGMTVLLMFALSATFPFASDWNRRRTLLLLRWGTSSRWLHRSLRDQFIQLLGYALAATILAVIVRVVTGNVGAIDWGALVVVSLITVIKLTLGAFLFAIAIVVAVTAFDSEISNVVVAASLLLAGLVPLARSPWYVVTSWSRSWSGSDNLTSTCALLAGVSVAFVGLHLMTRFKMELRGINGTR